MKKVFPLLLILVCIYSCNKTSLIERTITIPIIKYSTEAEAEANLKQLNSRQRNNLGNIYVYNDYLFVNERGEGIHIYDNSDSTNPINISFMQIPGNFDISIANNVLYADSFDDLLSFDISDISNFKLLERKNNIFPSYHPSKFGVVIGYKDSTYYTEESNDIIIFGGNNDDSESVSLANGNSSNVGVGGSFARFTYYNFHLYTVDRTTLRSFDVSNPSEIRLEDSEDLTANINRFITEVETIFNYQNHLFIGTTDGVFLYEAEQGGTISYKDAFTHATACDPVYVSDDIAFVTLRSNNENRCFNNINQLDIIDASDFNQLRFIKSAPMLYPHGIGVQDSLVFICEAQHGLKVFDYEKVFDQTSKLIDIKLELKEWNKSIEAIDIIPFKNHIIVVNQSSLHQYNYDQQGLLQFISSID